MPTLCALAALLVLGGCRSTGDLMQAAPASPDGIVRIVVANQQSASASILSEDGQTIRHVQVGTGPHEAAVSPDGTTAVVTIYGAQTPGSQLAIIDLVRDSVTRIIDLGRYIRPHGVVFLGGSSTRIAVTSEATNSVALVDLTNDSITAVPTNARGSHMVAVDAAGTRGWTGNIGDHTVSELDLAGAQFVRSISVPPRPEGIAVTPDGSEVWVGSNDTGAVTVISTATGEVTHTLTGARFPYRLGASPDGARIAVVDAMGHRLRIADVRTHSWSGEIELDSPRGVVIGADNRTAYVTQAAGTVAIVDIVELTVTRTLPVQASPDGVGVGVRRP